MRAKMAEVVAAAGIMLGGAMAQSQTRVWTATTNGTWSAGANWLGGGAPPVAGASVHFPNLQSGSVTATVDAAWSANGGVDGIVFDVGSGNNDWGGNDVLGSAGVTTFSLGGGGITLLDAFTNANPHEIAANVTLTTNQTWSVSPFAAVNFYASAKATSLRVSGIVSGAQPGVVLTKSGNDSLDLRGPNGALGSNIGALVLAGGTVQMLNGQVAGNDTNRIAAATAILSQGGTLTRGKWTINATQDMGQLTLSNGLLKLQVATTLDGTAAANSIYRFASLNAGIGAAAALTCYLDAQTPVRFVNVSGFPGKNGIVGAWAMVDSSSGQWLASPTANGTLAAVAGTSYNNATVNAAGPATNVNLITDASFFLTNNLTVNSIRYVGPAAGSVGTLDLGGYQLRLDSGGLAQSWASTTGAVYVTNGTLTVGAANDSGGTLYFHGGNLNGTLACEISALITDNGTGVVNVVKCNHGAGPLSLRGTNSYSGFTAVDAGNIYLYATDGANPGDNAPLGKVPTSFAADNIRLAGGGIRSQFSPMLIHSNRGIQLAGPGGAFGQTGGGVSVFTYNGVISGAGDLMFGDSGSYVLGGSQPNTYAGNTIVTGGGSGNGLLKPSKSSGVTTIPGNAYLLCPASVSVARGIQLGNSEQIADTAVITFVRPWGTGGAGTGTALFQLYGFNETLGGLVGTVAPGNPNLSLVVENGSASAASNSTLVLNAPGGAFYSYQGMVRNGSTGVLSVVKSGAGMQEFAGLNVYSGGTIISNGTLLASTPVAAQPVAVTGYTTTNSPVVTNLSSVAGLAVGQLITNSTTAAGLAGLMILSIDSASQITLNGNAISNGLRTIYFSAGGAAGTGPVDVRGGTLGGSGAVYGAVNVYSGGTVDPGAYPGMAGTLAVGPLTLNAGSTVTVDLGGSTANDRITVNGAIKTGGAVTVNLLGGYQPTAGQSWTIMTASGAIDDSVQMQAPVGYRVRKAGSNMVLSKVAPGLAILLR